MTGGRVSGRTAAQIRAAAQGAHFVVAHLRQADYVKRLARHLGREDLVVVTVAQCERVDRFNGRRDFTFVEDHALDEIVYSQGRRAYSRWCNILREMAEIEHRSRGRS